jgi:hypothetical protein
MNPCAHPCDRRVDSHQADLRVLFYRIAYIEVTHLKSPRTLPTCVHFFAEINAPVAHIAMRLVGTLGKDECVRLGMQTCSRRVHNASAKRSTLGHRSRADLVVACRGLLSSSSFRNCSRSRRPWNLDRKLCKSQGSSGSLRAATERDLHTWLISSVVKTRFKAAGRVVALTGQDENCTSWRESEHDPIIDNKDDLRRSG